MLRTRSRFAAALAVVLIGLPAARAREGIFEGHGDIGTVLHPGSVEYDASRGTYRLTGSGENMWFASDAFFFVWKKLSGDVSITADITFPTTTGNAHKKAALMIRQSLDSDAAYADAALHGNGLTSLQFRETAGANTHEIQANVTGPRRVRLTRQGKTVYLSVAMPGEELHPAGGAVQLELDGPFYIGLGVCAHDKDAVESAVFSNVQISTEMPNSRPFSTLETITVSSTDRRVVFAAPGRIESPRWLPDNSIGFLQDGHAYRVSADGGKPAPVEGAHATPTRVQAPGGSTLSFEGGVLRLTTTEGTTKPLARFDGGPASLTSAAWSPDGKRVVFVSYQMLP